MSKTILIRQWKPDKPGMKKKVTSMPEHIFYNFFSDADQWEVLEPEQQITAKPTATVRNNDPVVPVDILSGLEGQYIDRFGELPKEYKAKRSEAKKVEWLEKALSEE